MTPNQWNRNTRDSVVRLLTEAGFSEDSSVINQLECMNFDAPAAPQSDGVMVPRAIAERMAIDAAQYEHAVVNDNVQLWQQPGARLTLTVGDLRTVRALLGGDWVRAEDYDALRAENAELVAALERLSTPVGLTSYGDALANARDLLAKHRGD